MTAPTGDPSADRPASGDQPENPKPVRLSKSRYLSGRQCHRRLYLEIRAPGLATPPDRATQAMLEAGNEIGRVARERYPGGVLVNVGPRQSAEALRRTAELIADPGVPAIFEGAFEFDGVFVRVDILERLASGPEQTWRLIEVKSSTRVKEVHRHDVALQTYVLRGAGLSLAGCGLLLINTNYVYGGGAVDLARLFVWEDLTEGVGPLLAEVPRALTEQKAVLAAPAAPVIEPDAHCHSPHACPFWAHCTRDKPERWVFHLPGSSRLVAQLMGQGITTMDEIPPHTKLTVVQRLVRENVEWTSRGLPQVLRTVHYPVHHLDFETFMPAIPKFAGTRPYQAIPTQWSNYIEAQDGDLRQEAFLATESADPREAFAVSLLASVGAAGSICVYSQYEQAILEGLAAALPHLKAELLRVIDRLWDLLPIIREHYYHPRFDGSYSIKQVAPALVPSLDYGDLEIQEGGVAAREFTRMVFEVTDWVERDRIRQALLEYCARDTLAMVEIRRALWRKCAG